MLPIAHRGLWWPDKHKQNSPEAVEEAVTCAFGVEIDVWALSNGGLGVGHNDSHYNIRDFPSLKDAPLIAFNVKNPNCATPLIDYIAAIGAFGHSLVFDFELIGEDWTSPLAVSRISDRDDDRPKRDRHGYWMDCFRDEWRTEAAIREAVEVQGKKAYIVSPELHGKPLLLKQWSEWKEAHGICTDFPHLLSDFMATRLGLFPDNPWWN